MNSRFKVKLNKNILRSMVWSLQGCESCRTLNVFFYSAQMSELIIYWRGLWIVQEDKKLHSWMTEGKGGLFEKKWKKMYVFSMPETVLSVNGVVKEQQILQPEQRFISFVASMTWSYLLQLLLQFKMYYWLLFLFIFYFFVPLLHFKIPVIFGNLSPLHTE